MRSIVVLVLAVATTACTSSSSPPPTTQTLWHDGSAGALLGQTVSYGSYDGQAATGVPPCGDAITVVSCDDAIGGDTQGLQTLNKSCANLGNEGITFSTIATVDLGAYTSGGHVEFDLETVGGSLSFMFSIGIGKSGADAWYTFAQTSFTSTAFTHVSIPITDFGSYADVIDSVNELTLFTEFTGNDPQGYVLADVQLTAE